MDMRPELTDAVPRFAVSGVDGSHGLQSLNRETTRPLIPLCNILENGNYSGIVTFGEKILGSLLKLYHRDS